MLRTPPSDLRHVAFHKQTVDILVRKPASALVDGLRAFPESESGNAVVLRHDDVAFPTHINQRDIHRVGSGTDHLDFAVGRG